MKIGVPTEIKDHEYRVGLVPAGVRALSDEGHEVRVQRQAGMGSSITDEEYQAAGATLVDGPESIYSDCDMVIKVKEPLMPEVEMMREELLLFTYLHLAPLEELTQGLLDRRVTGIAYETITDPSGGLPLLKPMSEVAGRMAALVGAYYLQRPLGGRGILLSGVPGVPPGDVIIVGGGIVGLNCTKVAHGLGARVTVLDTNVERLRLFDDLFHGSVTTLASNHHNLAAATARADLVIGAVLLPGRSAPHVITRQMIKDMKPGSVFADVAVDQGGCAETTRATTHSDPVYEEHGVVHYCVTNMPGAVPRTSTFALNNVTLPYALMLANKGFERACAETPGLVEGVNTHKGHITYRAVAESQNAEYKSVAELS